MTASELTVSESLDLTDFKSVYGFFGEVSGSRVILSRSGLSNVGRGSQNSNSLIDAHTLSGSYRHFHFMQKNGSIRTFPKRYESLTLNEVFRRCFAFYIKHTS